MTEAKIQEAAAAYERRHGLRPAEDRWTLLRHAGRQEHDAYYRLKNRKRDQHRAFEAFGRSVWCALAARAAYAIAHPEEFQREEPTP